MKRLSVIVLLLAILVLGFCGGVVYEQITYQPQVIEIPVVETRIVEVPVEVPVEVLVVEYITQTEYKEIKVPSFELKEFPSQIALSMWQAQNYIGEQEGWNCVDYALEMQRRALLDGYQMSTECLIDKGGKTGHMICSAVIGNEVIFLEPQSTTSWVGGIKDDGRIGYNPILFIYSPEGELLQEIYREE